MSRLEGFSSYIKSALDSWHCPGVAVAVIKGEEVIHRSTHGMRDVTAELPVTPDTRFPLASVTKSFTAMSLALLVDEGRLDWDEPVREYMPEFILKDAYVTQHLTVRDMLSHRSGLPRHELAAWRLDIEPAELMKRMRHLQLSATFREKFQYNNLMYNAAAYLVEKLTERKWEDFVRERIFEPLGMSSSNFRQESPQADQPGAKGYRVERDELGSPTGVVEVPQGRQTRLSPGAAGALFSTLDDLIRWLRVHVNSGRSGDLQLVSPANLKQMHLPHTIVPGGDMYEALFGNTIFTYGLGWSIEPYKGLTLISHGGNVEGHSVMVGFVPRERTGVVVLTNAANMPLRDALLFESIDRALGLEESDWNARLHDVWDPLFAGREQRKQTSESERVAGAPASRELDAYVGQYEADGYPDFAVRAVDGSLQSRLIDNLPWSSLSHYHYDVFEWDLPDWELRMKVRFLSNDGGELDAVSIPIEPAVENVVYVRKPPYLSEETIAGLVGRYVPPVPGWTFSVTAVDERVYLATSGRAPKEMRPYVVTDDNVGFRLERLRLDFERENGEFVRLVYKSEALTITASRA